MSDNKGEEITPRGNEWEVVSLTSSAYAAGSGPMQVESNDNDKDDGTVDEATIKTSHALFMSGHFVFPPSQHENLPLEPEETEIHNVQGVENVGPELDYGEGTRSIAQFEEGTTVDGLNLVEEEQSIYADAKFSSFHSEATMGRSTTYDDNREIPELSERISDSDVSQFPKPVEEDNCDGSGLPCEAWWKRGAASLYAQAKDTNAFWSIFVAAAVMGLVMLGQRWQRERWQDLQLKWQISINDEKMSRMLGPLSRFKDVIVGGSRRSSFIRGGSTAER